MKSNSPKWIILLVLVFLLSAADLRAQDDFPPPGIWIPCCANPGGTGHTGATYGRNGSSAWRQVWGAAPGDVVTFEFILRSQSAGSLHAWPKTTGGTTDPQYLGDPGNPYQKWYWTTGERDSGGTFCISCPWQFTANTWNPWIYIDYWDSGDGWDVDLNVTNIQTPAPTQRNVVSPEKKAAAHAKADKQEKWGAALDVLTIPACAFIPFEGCLAIGVMAKAFQLDAARLRNVDPWDGDYCTQYDPVWNWYVVPGFQTLPEDGTTGPWGMAPYINSYMWNATVIDGLQDMIYVSTNRANSAWQAGDFGCSDMQYARTQWALQMAGQYYQNVATDIYNFSWFFANYWNPYEDLGEGPGYLSDYVYEMSQSYWELGWYFQQ